MITKTSHVVGQAGHVQGALTPWVSWSLLNNNELRKLESTLN